MADYDSDSSTGANDIESNVLLGYASNEPTGDDFSQLGGRPAWLDGKTTPSGAFAKCRVCNGVTNLLLQLKGDLPDWFPGHERRLYVFGCRRKPCRRKNGSIRALRAVRVVEEERKTSAETTTAKEPSDEPPNLKPERNVGEMLFGAKASSTSAKVNPFALGSSTSAATNPFSSPQPDEAPAPAASQLKPAINLPDTFAQKARISVESSPAPTAPDATAEPWPDDPKPYPSYYLDAEKEYLEAEPESVPPQAQLDTDGESSSVADEKALFESSMDKTFQHFADRLNQNPEQVLRYEFGGQPLLYADADAVGKLLSSPSDAKVQTSSSLKGSSQSSSLKIPRCTSCGSARVFEMQLTPHAITEMEADETSIDGMDWGTIIIGACGEDCAREGNKDVVSYFEEWVGVQWEELVEDVRK